MENNVIVHNYIWNIYLAATNFTKLKISYITCQPGNGIKIAIPCHLFDNYIRAMFLKSMFPMSSACQNGLGRCILWIDICTIYTGKQPLLLVYWT